MTGVNILEAKTNFSKLLLLLETKQESEIIICKKNKPIAKVVPILSNNPLDALGIAKGKLKYPLNINDGDSEIESFFMNSEDI